MSRAIRQMNLAGMSDSALEAMREAVARAIKGGQDDKDRLLEDIDHEIDLRRREP
jgi:hypothetical protein